MTGYRDNPALTDVHKHGAPSNTRGWSPLDAPTSPLLYSARSAPTSPILNGSGASRHPQPLRATKMAYDDEFIGIGAGYRVASAQQPLQQCTAGNPRLSRNFAAGDFGGSCDIDQIDYLNGKTRGGLNLGGDSPSIGGARWTPPGAPVTSAAAAKYASTLASIQSWLHSLSPEECTGALQSILYAFPYPNHLADMLDDFLSGVRRPSALAAAGSLAASSVGSVGGNKVPGVIGQQRGGDTDQYSSTSSGTSILSSPSLSSSTVPSSPYVQSQQGAFYSTGNGHSPLLSSKPGLMMMSSPAASVKSAPPAQSPVLAQPVPHYSRHQPNIDAPRPRSSGGQFQRMSSPLPQSLVHQHSNGGEARFNSAPLPLSPTPSSSLSQKSKPEKGRIPDSIEFETLENVPQWLRSLRLHKYTDVFGGVNPATKAAWKWREMIELSEAQLEALGVQALGARRKLLKVFEMVRDTLNGVVRDDCGDDDGCSTPPYG